MSSTARAKTNTGSVLVLFASLLALIWYGHSQLIHSLAFLYQIAQAVFPGLAALRGGG